MMQAPTLAEIQAAELRVTQSVQDTRDSYHRVQVALRETLPRTATLALVAVVTTGLLIFRATRRSRKEAIPPLNSVRVATTTSVAGLLLAFALRYGMRALPYILQQVSTTRQKPAA